MRLLRLTNNNNKGLFSLELKQDLNINKNSKIALHSLTAEQQSKTFEITTLNHEINATYTNSYTGTSYLDNNTYDSNNINNFLEDLTNKFNNTADYNTGSCHGYEWTVNKNLDIINISARRRDNVYETDFSAANPNVYNQNIQRTSGNMRPNNTAIGKYYAYDKIYLSKGCGIYRGSVFLGLQPSGGLLSTDKIIIGVMDNLPADNVVEDNIKYGVSIEGTGAAAVNNYFVIENNLYTDSGIPYHKSLAGDTNKDWVEIIKTTNKIIIFLYSYNGSTYTRHQLLNVDYSNENLYPFIYFEISDVNAGSYSRVGIQKTLTPIIPVDSSIIEPNLEAKPPTMVSNTGAVPIKNISLNFDLAQFLGFTNILPNTTNNFNHDFKGDNLFLLNSDSDSFIIESLDLKLQSFDNLTNSRKSILGVIPTTEIKDKYIVYESKNLLFLDIDNFQNLNIRNLRFRLYNRDYSPIILNGLSILTLIIKDNEE